MSDFVTYRHILEALKELTDEQLDMTASVYETDIREVIPITDTYTVENLPDNDRLELDGVVENEQPLFIVEFLDQKEFDDFVTYRYILEALKELSDEQLDMTAYVYYTGEVIPITDTFIVLNLPDNHRLELDGVVEDEQPLFVVGFLNQEHKNKG